MKFALRRQRSTTIYALLKAKIGEFEVAYPDEISNHDRCPSMGAAHTTPVRTSAMTLTSTPPLFHGLKFDFKGKGKENEANLNNMSYPSSNDGSAHEDSKATDQPYGLTQSGIKDEMLPPMLPSSGLNPAIKPAISRFRSNSALTTASSVPTLLANMSDSGLSSSTSATLFKDVSTSPRKHKTCSQIHDHVMVIPTMPHPNYPTNELLYNPLTETTEYIMHLTSRHDYGPVYSHRYFICPLNLEDDWIELTLLQWFARGQPFNMKAEKWDIKCEDDSRFFRLTLRPNLDMRSYH